MGTADACGSNQVPDGYDYDCDGAWKALDSTTCAATGGGADAGLVKCR